MIRRHLIPALAFMLAGNSFLPAADDEPTITFKSDVALVRIDVQVLSRDGRAITGLRQDDFVLTEQGRRQEIRNFAREKMPLDVLFLLDVSASMRPHVQRIADASHQAIQVLGPEDRVAIMVFDTSSRVRMPFRDAHRYAERGLEQVLDVENFRGGTHITRGLMDAASYMGRESRREARHAIIIVTDDMTQDRRDEEGVNRALTRADSVLCALIAPDAMGQRGGYGGRRGGGGWPGGGGGGLGGIIFGGPGMGGGRRGGGYGVNQNHSAGTREIARTSGGDDMAVEQSDALEDTLSRLRNRYAIYFYAPADARAGDERNIDVHLTTAALRRYPDADVRFRRVYLAPGGGNDPNAPPPVYRRSTQPEISRSQDVDRDNRDTYDRQSDDAPVMRRRPAVDGSGTRGSGPLLYPGSDNQQQQQNQQSAPSSVDNNSGNSTTATPSDSNTNRGGWRRVPTTQQ